MASSSSSSLSSNNVQERHEVFLSFRGEDTRKTFTAHLHAAFKRHEIKTYIDYNLERGDEISGTLLRAIEDAKLSLVVFSKNYASSTWCLDELKKIIECRKSRGQIVLPVFYDVEPTNVRRQSETYATAFERHEQRFRDRPNKVQEWRDALLEAANHSGWDCNVNRSEAELVEEIAKDVLQKLNRAFVGDLDQEIAKYEQLAKLQMGHFLRTPHATHYINHKATVERINKLKMERNHRLLRIPSNNYATVEDPNPQQMNDMYMMWSNLSAGAFGGLFR